MNDFCVELDIDISPFTETYDITTQILPQISISLDYINPKLVDLLNQCGLTVEHIVSFKRYPKNKSLIHSDTFIENDEFVKLNWIYGGKNSSMNWYLPKHPDSGIKRLNMINTPYINYSPNDVDLIATYYTQNKAYIVQTGIPHDVVNPEEIRYCISCVLNINSGEKLTMSRAKSLLAKYITSN